MLFHARRKCRQDRQCTEDEVHERTLRLPSLPLGPALNCQRFLGDDTCSRVKILTNNTWTPNKLQENFLWCFLVILCLEKNISKSKVDTYRGTRKTVNLALKKDGRQWPFVHECVLNSSTSNQCKAVVFDPHVTHYGTCILYIIY